MGQQSLPIAAREASGRHQHTQKTFTSEDAEASQPASQPSSQPVQAGQDWDAHTLQHYTRTKIRLEAWNGKLLSTFKSKSFHFFLRFPSKKYVLYSLSPVCHCQTLCISLKQQSHMSYWPLVIYPLWFGSHSSFKRSLMTSFVLAEPEVTLKIDCVVYCDDNLFPYTTNSLTRFSPGFAPFTRATNSQHTNIIHANLLLASINGDQI